MTVNYTTNLALGQPVTGTESGTWGDDVNNAVTAYLDIAIAGGLAVAVTTADVTLTNTQGTSSATNIGSTTAQYAILNVSGAMTAARNLIVPSSSKWYIVNNACTGGFLLTVKGSATSGVTLTNGEKALLFWNGTDYVKAATQGGTGALPLPAGTTAQQPASPTVGMLRYNSTTNAFEGYSGVSPAWSAVGGGGATGGGTDKIFIENGQTVTTNYTITTSNNAGTFGPVSVDSGVTVTVPTGSVWTVV
jgi:hypothetical protein